MGLFAAAFAASNTYPAHPQMQQYAAQVHSVWDVCCMLGQISIGHDFCRQTAMLAQAGKQPLRPWSLTVLLICNALFTGIPGQRLEGCNIVKLVLICPAGI